MSGSYFDGSKHESLLFPQRRASLCLILPFESHMAKLLISEWLIMFPHLINDFGHDHILIMTDRHDGQNNKNKTQVVIKQNYCFSSVTNWCEGCLSGRTSSVCLTVLTLSSSSHEAISSLKALLDFRKKLYMQNLLANSLINFTVSLMHRKLGLRTSAYSGLKAARNQHSDFFY